MSRYRTHDFTEIVQRLPAAEDEASASDCRRVSSEPLHDRRGAEEDIYAGRARS